ncbi:MAG: hypothetical protein LBG10_04855, partial [Treponema sp.]|nr:hypothetical protein [Treponema sp.]
MAMERRGRRPKVAENEELLNFDQGDSSPEGGSGADNAGNSGEIPGVRGNPSPGENGESSDDDNGEKPGGRARVIRAKRAAPRPETRNRHSRGQAGGPAHTGTVSGAGYVPGNNGNREPLAYEINGGALPAAGPSERGEAPAASLPALPVHLPSMP